MTPEELLQNFELLCDWEDKYRYLIELGEKLPPYPETDKNDAHKVEGCQSQVWITHKTENNLHYFSATSDSQIVKGLQAVLITLINGKTTQEIQQLNLHDIFRQLGLEEHLSPTRRNGFAAMVNRIALLIL